MLQSIRADRISLRPLQFLFRQQIRLELVHFGHKRGFHILQDHARGQARKGGPERIGEHIRQHVALIFVARIHRSHIVDAQLLAQLAEHYRPLPSAQSVGRDSHGGEVTRPHPRSKPPDHQAGVGQSKLCLRGVKLAPVQSLVGHAAVDRQPAFGHAGKCLSRPVHGLLDRHIPYDRKDHVVRHIIRGVELLKILLGSLPYCALIADSRPPIAAVLIQKAANITVCPLEQVVGDGSEIAQQLRSNLLDPFLLEVCLGHTLAHQRHRLAEPCRSGYDPNLREVRIPLCSNVSADLIGYRRNALRRAQPRACQNQVRNEVPYPCVLPAFLRGPCANKRHDRHQPAPFLRLDDYRHPVVEHVPHDFGLRCARPSRSHQHRHHNDRKRLPHHIPP